MSADEMFERLGYEQMEPDPDSLPRFVWGEPEDEFLIYRRHIGREPSDRYIDIEFDLEYRSVEIVEYVYRSGAEERSRFVPLTPDLIGPIGEKMRELGWLG